MAKVCMVIPQTDLTVTTSIARNVVKDLIKYTGFPSDAEIIIDTLSGGARSLSGFTNTCELPIRTEQRNYVFVTITERYTEDGTVTGRQPNHFKKKIFNDPDIGLSIDPVYSKVEIELALRFRTRDLTTMRSWVSGLRVNDSFDTNKFHHSIKYDYSLPVSMINFLVEAYNMTERVAPRGQRLKEFIEKGFNGGFMKRKNLNGSHTEFIVNEVQTGVSGFKLTDYPYNEYTSEEGVYELQYPYKILFDRIDAATLTTPLIIHNQFIPNSFIEAWFRRENPQYQPFGYRDNGWIVDDLADDKFDLFYKGDGGSRLIPYDDYYPTTTRPDTMTIFLSPVRVDPDNPTVLMNINDIDNTLIPKQVKDYLMKFSNGNVDYRAGLVSIEVYETYKLERRLAVNMDPDGLLKTEAPMKLGRRNYVKIDLIKDFTLFPTTLTEKLLDEGTVLAGLCTYIDPAVVIGPSGTPGLDIRQHSDNSLDHVGYTRWLSSLKDVNSKFKGHHGRVTKTVQIGRLLLRRKK